MPGRDALTPPSEALRLAREVRASGNLGITTAQLVRVTGASPGQIEEALGPLVEQKLLARIGRGLWIDRPLLENPGRRQDFVAPARYLEQFEEASRRATERYRGDIQFRPNTDEPVHRWWPYVQGFSAGFVRAIAQRHGIGPGTSVLDPYAGSGTVPVVARALGAEAIGVELMPISAFVARAKQRWAVPPDALRSAARELLRTAPRGRPSERPFLRETDRQFAPGPLDRLLRLRRALFDLDAEPAVSELLRLAFARILVDASRLRRSPCLGYAPKPEVAPSTPYRLFEEAVERTAQDLARLQAEQDRWGPPAKILEEDARALRLPRASVDLAVTSPPYVNGMDYVMNYKLEMAWLGLVGSYEALRALKARMVACDNLPKLLAARGLQDAGALGDPWLRDLLERLRANLASKGTYRRPDMDAVVASYFADLGPTIRAVHRALRPGGRFVVVNGDSLLAGTYVPGDLLFARRAEREGFRVERFEIARERRSGQRREFRLRESVLTLVKEGS